MRYSLTVWSFLLLFVMEGLLPAAVRAQTWAWAQAPVAAASPNFSRFLNAGVDAAGNTVVAGTFVGPMTLGSFTLPGSGASGDVFVARLSPSGQWIQAVQAGGAGYDLPSGIAVAPTGEVIVTGTFQQTATFGTLAPLVSAGDYDVFVARLSASGQWTQAVRAGGPGADNGGPMAVAADGTVVFSGTYAAGAQFGSLPALPVISSSVDVFVARFSPAGQWTQVVHGGAPGADFVGALALEADGTAVVSGWVNGPAFFDPLPSFNTQGARQLFVARFGLSGAWTQVFTNTPGFSGQAIPYALALDATGAATIAGTYNGPTEFGSLSLPYSGFGDIFVARCSAAGVWTQAVRAGSTSSDAANQVLLDANGTATVSGYFAQTATFGTLAPLVSNGGGLDTFIAELSPAGTWTRAIRAGGPGDELPRALVRHPAGGFVFTGQFPVSIDFGATRLTTSAPEAGFVARLTSLPTATKAAAPAARLALVPNPAHGTAALAVPAGAGIRSAQMLDALGREVRCQAVPAGANTVTFDLAGLAPGVYVVRCGAASTKLLVE